MADPKKKKSSLKAKKPGKKKQHAVGNAVVKVTFNNVHVTITSLKGDVLTKCTSGKLEFKSAKKKSTPHAAEQVARDAATAAYELYGMRTIETLKVNGPGPGRDSACRAIKAAGLTVKVLMDVTPLPHNGCRPPKERRV